MLVEYVDDKGIILQCHLLAERLVSVKESFLADAYYV